MTLEPALYVRLTQDPTLAGYLAKFGNPSIPAVFDRLAPADSDVGWYGRTQYPRIVYALPRARRLSDILIGQVTVSIWTRDDVASQTGIDINVLRNRVLDLLDEGALYSPDEGAFVLKFVSETPFQGTADALVVGSDLKFDFRLIEFQGTFSPDPMMTFERWGKDRLPTPFQWNPDTWTPEDDAPAVFPRLVKRHSDMVDYGIANCVRWVDIDVDFHVFAHTVNARAFYSRQIADQLRQDLYLKMDDGSCMYIMNVDENLNISPLVEGQLKVSARYGTLAIPYAPGPGGIGGIYGDGSTHQWPVGPNSPIITDTYGYTGSVINKAYLTPFQIETQTVEPVFIIEVPQTPVEDTESSVLSDNASVS
jgi:hypothetical protein